MNVLFAMLNPTRLGHADATKVLAAAVRGDAALAVPPQGVLADLHGNFYGELAFDLRALLARPGFIRLPQLSWLSNVTFPGAGLYPGNYYPRFGEAWTAISTHWKTHQGKCPGDEDRWYVEAHLCAHNAVIVTDDVPLRVMCERLRSEQGIEVVATSLANFAQRF